MRNTKLVQDEHLCCIKKLINVNFFFLKMTNSFARQNTYSLDDMGVSKLSGNC